MAGAGCAAGLPRRSTGRLGSFSSGDAAGGAFEAGAWRFRLLSIVAEGRLGIRQAQTKSGGEAFSVGRSESSSDFGGALLFAVELPPPDGGRISTRGGSRRAALSTAGRSPYRLLQGGAAPAALGSSLSTSCAFGFGLGCFAACWAIRASTGVSGFHCPSATQLPLTSRGVVTVNHPAGSP